ncbi:MAG: type II toxin-antitoxin system PemK/MazF family toxin [Geobacteraceae bacterium]|nr:type II toxin-antitoxin system PemK/MazF family toxin [Geobacteraceae bacterium]
MRQGEIWLVNLDPTLGAEIRKTRPCVILNDDAIGGLPLKVIAPLTDLKARYQNVPWMLCLEPDSSNCLSKPSAIDLFQVRCLSESRLVHKIGAMTTKDLALAQKALKLVFGME